MKDTYRILAFVGIFSAPIVLGKLPNKLEAERT